MGLDDADYDGEHSLDDYPCRHCDAAYPHPLLREKHTLDEHPEAVEVTPPTVGA